MKRLWLILGAAVAAIAVFAVVAAMGLLIDGGDEPTSGRGVMPRAETGRNGLGPPTVADHWHAAYGIYICDEFLPPLANNGRDPDGIHSHGDGLIHVHPFSRKATGDRAVLGVFEAAIGITLDSREIRLPGTRHVAGKDTCNGRPAAVRVLVNGQPYVGDPSTIKLEDRQAIVVAFAPLGAEIPRFPPSMPNLDNLSDVVPA